MIHPSYTELMQVVNSGVEADEQPVVQSRYSIVIATSKRARQIIAGQDPMVKKADEKKPLSIAVEELYNKDLKILSEEDATRLAQEREAALEAIEEIRASEEILDDDEIIGDDDLEDDEDEDEE